MTQYNVEELIKMSRMDLIAALRPIAHPQTFHQLLKWPTDALRIYIVDSQKLKSDTE